MRDARATGRPVPDALLAEFSAFLGARVGLQLPSERWPELAARMEDAARESGHADARSYMVWLMQAPLARAQVEGLANHLTNGETFFFREYESLLALDEILLAELIRLRRSERRLRIWSAGCSSGEEAYSIAMLLDRRQAELAGWEVTILATDINPGVLRKAAQAHYGEWSFRGVAPDIKARYFRKTPDERYELLPRIRERVTFAYLNLAEDAFPSLDSNTTAIDIIVCRNVLMYFTADAARSVVARFHRALREGGGLIVGVAEAPQLQLHVPHWRALGPNGGAAFRKAGQEHLQPTGGSGRAKAHGVVALTGRRHRIAAAAVQPVPANRTAIAGPGAALAEARSLYQQGRHADAAALLEAAASPGSGDAQALLARCHANLGNLAAALAVSRKALAADKINPAPHYVHALIQTEAGHLAEALRSLRRTLYLDQDFVPAHIALAGLSLRRGERGLSRKHLEVARALLARYDPQDLVPESDGMSAGCLARMVESMQELTHASP